MAELGSTKDSIEGHYIMVIYGKSGSGKTKASSTVKDQLRIDISIGEGDGSRTIADEDIPTIYVKSYYDLLQTMIAIHGGPIKVDPSAPEMAVPSGILSVIMKDPGTKKLIDAVKKLSPKAIVIDSLYSTQDLFLKQSRVFHGKNMGKMHYGDLARLGQFWVEFMIMHEEFNWILVTLEGRIHDEDVGGVFYGPQYPGQASDDILNPKMSFILPIEIRPDLPEWAEGRNRHFKTQGDGRYLVKVRNILGVKLPTEVPAHIDGFVKNLAKRTAEKTTKKAAPKKPAAAKPAAKPTKETKKK